MKTYKDFGKISIGASDIASLTVRSCMNTYTLNFGEDNSYSAYFVTEDAEIGSHYKECFSGNHWLWIYDDEELTARISCESFKIYRAGQMGCIIYVKGFDENRSFIIRRY